MVAVIAPQAFYVLSHSRSLRLDFCLQEYCTSLPLHLAKCWSSRLAHLKPTSSVKFFLTSPGREISFLGGWPLHSLSPCLLIWPEAVLLMIYTHERQKVSPMDCKSQGKFTSSVSSVPCGCQHGAGLNIQKALNTFLLILLKKSSSENNDNEEWEVGEKNSFSSKERWFLWCSRSCGLDWPVIHVPGNWQAISLCASLKTSLTFSSLAFCS